MLILLDFQFPKLSSLLLLLMQPNLWLCLYSIDGFEAYILVKLFSSWWRCNLRNIINSLETKSLSPKTIGLLSTKKLVFPFWFRCWGHGPIVKWQVFWYFLPVESYIFLIKLMLPSPSFNVLYFLFITIMHNVLPDIWHQKKKKKDKKRQYKDSLHCFFINSKAMK